MMNLSKTLFQFIYYLVLLPISINGQIFCVPMAIEESSVVAAAKNARFWMERGF